MEFLVKGLRAGQLERLRLAATDEASATRLAREQGYAVLSVRTARWTWLHRRRGARRFPVLLHAQELLALLRAGLSLIEALEALHDKEPTPEHRQLQAEVLARLREGKAFSQALEHPRGPGAPAQTAEVFPPLLVASVRAAERTGDLPNALARFVAYREQLDAVRKKALAAMIYPALLMGVGTLVLLFLVFYVVPRFGRVYADLGRELPFFSSLLLQAGQALDAYGMAPLLLLALASVWLTYALARGGARAQLVARIERLPFLRERMRVFHLARFYRTTGMLQGGGIALLTAAGMARGLLGPVQAKALETGLRLMSEGRSFSDAMHASGLTTPVALRMLAVGERAGNMAEMMERIALFHDEELARWLERFVKLFEPLLMAALGLAVGAIILLMYMPIFELAGSLG